jgi:hypothetical protein
VGKFHANDAVLQGCDAHHDLGDAVLRRSQHRRHCLLRALSGPSFRCRGSGLAIDPCRRAAGYFLADFAFGAVHWSMDTWLDERTLGRAIAIVREHHTHPHHVHGYSFLDFAALGSTPSAMVFGFAVLVTALFPVSAATYALTIMGFVNATCMLFGTSFHNLAHRPARSAVMRLAQRLHLVCPPTHHWASPQSDDSLLRGERMGELRMRRAPCLARTGAHDPGGHRNSAARRRSRVAATLPGNRRARRSAATDRGRRHKPWMIVDGRV